jgi:glycosyltransferase involved in cell wall biosynthesis
LKFTLIVTGFDRADELDRFMRSIGDQSLTQGVELILVNQSTIRPSSCDALPPAVRFVEVRTGIRVPLSKARNIGLENYCGEIVAFPDDDCWYEPSLLSKVALYFEQNPAVDCICTGVYDPDAGLSYGKRPLGVSRRVSFSNVFKLCISVGIFVRRRALERAGAYFDECLGAGTPMGAGEETELLVRMLSARCRIEYVGQLQVYHSLPKFAPSDAEKNYRYGVGFGHLTGRVLFAGHPGALCAASEVVVRSIGGAVVNLQRPLLRAVYWNRLAGVVAGFAGATIQAIFPQRDRSRRPRPSEVR